MNFVYITTNLTNGKQYVGSHRGEINDSYLGFGKLVHIAIKKYGRENFERKILEICDEKHNLILEEKYIKEFKTLTPDGYNLSPTGGVKGGGRLNKETKRKLSIAHKGKKLSNEHKQNLSKALKNREFSEETKNKISESLKGKPSPNKGVKMSDEQKKKIGDANRGRKLSKETKEKMKGEKSPEHKKSISESLKGNQRRKGKKHSEETKRKIKEARKKQVMIKGWHHSEETKEKIRNTLKSNK